MSECGDYEETNAKGSKKTTEEFKENELVLIKNGELVWNKEGGYLFVEMFGNDESPKIYAIRKTIINEKVSFYGEVINFEGEVQSSTLLSE